MNALIAIATLSASAPSATAPPRCQPQQTSTPAAKLNQNGAKPPGQPGCDTRPIGHSSATMLVVPNTSTRARCLPRRGPSASASSISSANAR